jgi:hypothetical protein
LGLLNKHLVLFLLFGLLTGLLLTRQRRLLASKWPWLGAALALVIWSPNLVWQAQNGWPTREMMQSLQDENSGLGKAVEFLALQLPLLSIVLIPIAVIGVRRMLKDDRYRPIAVGFLALVIVMLVAGGKGYYIIPFYVVFLPMGMVEMEERWAAGLARVSVIGAVVAMAAGVVFMSPFFLPVLPAGSISFFNAVNPELGETVGWEEMVDQVAAVHGSLTDDERRTATIFTGSYGEAGAVDLFGPDVGLPAARSGHNAYWTWGPPPDGSEPVIVVGYGRGWMNQVCNRWRPAGTIENAAGIDNEEMGLPISVCLEMRRPWSAVWDDARHYN